MNMQYVTQLILGLILGGMAVFSYAPFDFWYIAFISFTGLLLLINQETMKKTVLIAFVWSIGYFLAGAHWIYVSINQYGDFSIFLSITILLLFVSYLSLYPILFVILLRLFRQYCPTYSFKQYVVLVPLIWQLTEYMRGSILNGFAWLQFGYTQLTSPLSGLFPLFGINGVNFIFSICCGILAYLISSLSVKNSLKNNCHSLFSSRNVISLLMAIFIVSAYFKTVHWTEIDKSRQVNVSLIQGNIAQSLRWEREQLHKTTETYKRLTQEHINSSDIIIWSEASVTDLEINQQPYLQKLDRLATQHNAAIAVGIIDLMMQADGQPQIYNSLVVLGDETPYQYPTINRYNKHHLVPFGEYIPFESVLRPIVNFLNIPMSSMSSGQAVQSPLIMKGFKFTTVICYEVILSDLVLNNFTADTDFLLTVSNDTWFGDSIGSWQHLQMASARALEFGRTLLRSTNNGVTAVITPQGEIAKKIPQFKEAVLSITLSPNTGLTPYARWGNTPYYMVLILFTVLVFIRRKNRQML